MVVRVGSSLAQALGFLIGLTLFSCGNRDSVRLAGEWKVTGLEAKFDERRVNPQTFNQVMAYLKKTRLVFENDSVVVYERAGRKDKLKWYLDQGDRAVIIEGDDAVFITLSLSGNRMQTTEQSPLGQVVLVFTKQDN
ncbi:MAG: hypothetical protein IPM52_08010 [Bacteroidetes bacterium]|nr:hypothetical protein [Bacteroidota bacterium]